MQTERSKQKITRLMGVTKYWAKKSVKGCESWRAKASASNVR
jgi:hypothetical protein